MPVLIQGVGGNDVGQASLPQKINVAILAQGNMAQSHRGPDPVMSSSRPSIDLRTGEVVILEDIEPFVGGEVDLIDVGALVAINPSPQQPGGPKGPADNLKESKK